MQRPSRRRARRRVVLASVGGVVGVVADGSAVASLVVRAAGMRSRWTGLDIPNFGYTLSNLDRSRDYWALVVLGGLALAAVFVSMATMRRGLAEVRQASATRRELESTRMRRWSFCSRAKARWKSKARC